MKNKNYGFKDIFIIWGLWAISLNIIKKIIDLYQNNFDFSLKTIFVTTYLISYFLLFFLIYIFTCKKYGKSLKKEFFIKKISLKNTIMSLTFGLSMAITFIFLSELDFQKIKGDNLSVMIYYVLVSSVIGPFVEEIFARGVLYNYLTRKTNIVISILLINIWFVIAHMHLKNENTILFFISIFIAGTIFNLQRYFYKSLTPSIITHFSYNFITGIYTIILVIK